MSCWVILWTLACIYGTGILIGAINHDDKRIALTPNWKRSFAEGLRWPVVLVKSVMEFLKR